MENTGKFNTGLQNSGNRNSGYRNSGDWNSGDWNSGYQNSGNRNSGNLNSGDRNSGNRNSGNRNSGDWNSANYSAGIFCSTEPELFVFNKNTHMTRSEFFSAPKLYNIRRVLFEYSLPLTYIDVNKLLNREYKEACKIWWNSIPDELKDEFVQWEYFDADVFEEITGIRV